MKVSITIKADFIAELPSLPNFIKMDNGQSVDIKDIHDSSLADIAERWKQALIAHAENRRKGKV